MLLTSCEINIALNCSKNCVIAAPTPANQATTLAITDTTFYFPVVTLSTNDNAKLLQQFKSGFKPTIN